MTDRLRRTAAALLVATALAAGCSVRDERAVGSGAPAWWATATGEARHGLVADPTGSEASAPTIDYVDGFAAGERRAAETARPRLVVFGAGWCRWSGDLVAAVSRDPELVTLARRTICVLVDADRDSAACERFSVRAFPTVVLLDAAGNERFRGTGSSATASLAAALADVLAKPASAPRIADGEPRTRR
jgi:hypothetical protein